MDAPIRISVITPSFNSIHTIRDTLESVATQDYPHVEHIVMDGGSTDGTLDVVHEFPRVRCVSEKDEGHWHAMDKGIMAATGEFFGVLNSDDCYRPGALRAVAEAAAAHPEWEGVFGDVVFVDEHGQEIFRREEAFWDPQIVLSGFALAHHQALFLRRSLYERLGSYRYKEFKNACDIEYLLRMVRAGVCIGHIRCLVVNFRYHSHGQSADVRIRENAGRESTRIRAEYGLPTGRLGRLHFHYGRLRRQVEKLFVLGKCDLLPGNWLLRRHLREKTAFSSNIGLDKL